MVSNYGKELQSAIMEENSEHKRSFIVYLMPVLIFVNCRFIKEYICTQIISIEIYFFSVITNFFRFLTF